MEIYKFINLENRKCNANEFIKIEILKIIYR